MSIDHDFPRSSIDRSGFALALKGGAFDDCLYLLREDDGNGPDAARLNCELAELLFHKGRRDDALECGRRAFTLAGDDETVAHYCAWLFSNCGNHAEAAEAYERLLDLHPDWVEGYRHLSGSLAASGNSEAAIVFATKASDLAPDNADFALHAGELLLRAERAGDALALLHDAARRKPANPALWRLISAAESQREDMDRALAAIDRALDLAPDTAEYHVHRGHLLYRLGEFTDAADAFNRAAELDPANHALWRAQIDMLLAEGRVTDATALGGELLRAFPEDDNSAEAVLRALMIALDRVSKTYRTGQGRRVVLNDASAEFPSGCNIGILGANGAGKSTLIRLLAGSELPDRGKIRRNGRVSFPLGYGGTFHGSLSGRENVAFLARVYAADLRETASYVAEFAELGEYFRYYGANP